jgi:hypothetical protein
MRPGKVKRRPIELQEGQKWSARDCRQRRVIHVLDAESVKVQVGNMRSNCYETTIARRSMRSWISRYNAQATNE